MAGRYSACETAHLVLPDGREVAYLLPRRPPPSDPPVMARHRVGHDERPDLLAARHLGDPTAFWAVCDANRVLDPAELTATEGAVIDIPGPGVV
jgi:hypothetical protein